MNKLYDVIKKKELNGLDVSSDEIDTFLLYKNLKLQREVLEELKESNRIQQETSRHVLVIKAILVFYAVFSVIGILAALFS